MPYEVRLQGHATWRCYEDDLRRTEIAFHFDEPGARLDQMHQEDAYSFTVSNLIV